MGTIWFLAIIVFGLIGSFPSMLNREILWLLLMVCGAIVAMHNVRKDEEVTFLVATTSLLVILVCMKVAAVSIVPFVDLFVYNIAIGFGTAAFVVALALIAKLGLEK
jgi:hypothetical protein